MPEKKKRGRPEQYPERLIFRFREGTTAKLDSLAERKGKTRADVVRDAIERMLKRG